MARRAVARSVTAAAPLAAIAALLDAAGIRFMVVGSLASTFHGPPRTTIDVDLVVEISESSLTSLLRLIDRDRFYVPDGLALEAVGSGGQFNIVDLETGWKIDLMVRRDRPFSREEFERRHLGVIEGVEVFVASAEDTVLAKLEWAVVGGSDRQITDAASVIAFTGERINDDYLDRWAIELGIVEALARARSESGGGGG